MSVTWYCPEAPRVKVSNPCWGNCDESCPDCHGTNVCEEDESPHYLNLANTNAHNILTLLGYRTDDGDLWGAWDTPEEIRRVRAAILTARNVQAHRVPALRDDEDYGGPGTGTCRVLTQGYTDDQVIERLERLDTLLAFALDNGYGVSWG